MCVCFPLCVGIFDEQGGPAYTVHIIRAVVLCAGYFNAIASLFNAIASLFTPDRSGNGADRGICY